MAGKGMRALKDRVRERLESMVKDGHLSTRPGDDYTITETAYSDYHGSDYQRANLLTLSRDYPGTVTEHAGGVHGDAYGWIPRSVVSEMFFLGFADTEARINHVLDLIEGLREYPVLSDEDLSEVQETIAREAWDGYYEYEFRKAVEKARAASCPACVAWEESEYGSGVPMCPDLTDHDVIDDATAYEMFRLADEWSSYRAAEMDWHGDIDAVAAEYVAAEREAAAVAAREAEDALHSGGLFPAA